ncbi:hypothetical protein M9Y10_008286 [Tritrichomonas musculus]|uniref:Bromo domain-containing protein n=1 Tax=Tritrichomonas musculus TaxID=1915356 RepID=A0ABR2IYT7_9EUKA
MFLNEFQREQRKQIINKLEEMPIGAIFREIHPEEIPQYREIIKRPMDLEKVKRHLTNKKEYTSRKFEEEMKLIFDNCRLFNQGCSIYVWAADELEKIYEKKMGKIAPTPRERWLKDISNVGSKLKSATKQLSNLILDSKSDNHSSK